jgi:hypothetical protein
LKPQKKEVMTENLIFPRRKECEASEEQGRGWGGRERNARRVSVPIGINWGSSDPLKKKKEKPWFLLGEERNGREPPFVVRSQLPNRKHGRHTFSFAAVNITI